MLRHLASKAQYSILSKGFARQTSSTVPRHSSASMQHVGATAVDHIHPALLRSMSNNNTSMTNDTSTASGYASSFPNMSRPETSTPSSLHLPYMTENAENISPTADPYSDVRFGLQNEKTLPTSTPIEPDYLIPRPSLSTNPFTHFFCLVHSTDTLGRTLEVPLEDLLSQRGTQTVDPLFNPDSVNDHPLEFSFACSGTPYHHPQFDTAREHVINSFPNSIKSNAGLFLSLDNGTDTTMHKFNQGINEQTGELITKKLPCLGAYDKMTWGDFTSFGCGDDSIVGSAQLVGLADGVSGCEGNSGLWSRTLLNNTLTNFAINYNSEDQQQLDMHSILYRSYVATKSLFHSLNETGSSTLVLAHFNKTKSALEVLNIGDSMLYVIRDGQIAWKTEPKKAKTETEDANCPQQIGTHTILHPGTCCVSTVPVQEGDLVLLCSDGVSDNLWEAEIERILAETYYAYTDAAADADTLPPLQPAVDALVKEATSVSFDNFAVCPYHETSRKALQSGGKNDDISVLLTRVGMEEGPSFIP